MPADFIAAIEGVGVAAMVSAGVGMREAARAAQNAIDQLSRRAV